MTAAPAADRDEVPAAERGATRVADRAVAQVAARAAREALRAGPGADTLPRGDENAPRADARVRDQQTARVRVAVELGYPSDIGTQCGAVRQHVAIRVKELTDIDVPEVLVRVERLHGVHSGGGPGRRVR